MWTWKLSSLSEARKQESEESGVKCHLCPLPAFPLTATFLHFFIVWPVFWPVKNRKIFTRDSWDSELFLKRDTAQYISLFLLPEWVSVPGARPFLDEEKTKPQMEIGRGQWAGYRLGLDLGWSKMCSNTRVFQTFCFVQIHFPLYPNLNKIGFLLFGGHSRTNKTHLKKLQALESHQACKSELGCLIPQAESTLSHFIPPCCLCRGPIVPVPCCPPFQSVSAFCLQAHPAYPSELI